MAFKTTDKDFADWQKTQMQKRNAEHRKKSHDAMRQKLHDKYVDEYMKKNAPKKSPSSKSKPAPKKGPAKKRYNPFKDGRTPTGASYTRGA